MRTEKAAEYNREELIRIAKEDIKENQEMIRKLQEDPYDDHEDEIERIQNVIATRVNDLKKYQGREEGERAA